MVAIDLQRKYQYKIAITTNFNDFEHSGDGLVVDEFTPPDKRFDVVSRQNKSLGNVSLNGPATYGEMTLRLALRITGDDPNPNAQLIEDLQRMNDHDADTCNVVLMTLDSSEAVKYKQVYDNCRLTGLKFDALSRKSDDDMLHIELSLMPGRVLRVDGDEMPGE